jgi:hypothetical protein
MACTAAGCPTGSVCDPGTLACRLAGADAGTGPGPGPDSGAPPDGPPGCHGVGCICSGPSDCTSGICSDQLTITPELYAAANKTNFCTRPCCTSSDCEIGSVCFASGAGGSYCVLPGWLGRLSDVGTAIGGTACDGDGACRSGLCANGTCADTCCSVAPSGTACAPGTVCRYGAFPGIAFDVHDAAHCAPPAGMVANGAVCQAASDCQSGLCVGLLPSRCRDACRSSTDCGAGHICGYALVSSGSSSDVVAGCENSQGSAAEGASCQSNGDCQTGFCGASHQCTDVCFADTDCTYTGWRCRPETVQFGGSYSVLCCGS